MVSELLKQRMIERFVQTLAGLRLDLIVLIRRVDYLYSGRN